MNTDADISKFLFTLSEAFPGQVKTGTLNIFMAELKDRLAEVDLNVIQSKLIAECDFFPTAKKILEVVKSRREVERAQSHNLLPEAQANYVDANEFFKGQGVANFAEYLQKLKREKTGPEGA